MASRNWTDEENNRVVEDYFAMLADELAGNSFKKSLRIHKLISVLNERSGKSIKNKYHNISAVLKGLGQVWIDGYKPLFHFQKTLVDAVVSYLDENPIWLPDPLLYKRLSTELSEAKLICVGLPPTLSNQPPPKELKKMLHIARKWDVAGRDARNRDLGRAGEECVFEHERAILHKADRDDLANKVRWVSRDDGDGAGYDISSFTPDGCLRLIEVKTTNGWDRSPFYISKNELAVANEHKGEWRLFRVWNFCKEPKAFKLRPPLDAHVTLTAESFKASFRTD